MSQGVEGSVQADLTFRVTALLTTATLLADERLQFKLNSGYQKQGELSAAHSPRVHKPQSSGSAAQWTSPVAASAPAAAATAAAALDPDPMTPAKGSEAVTPPAGEIRSPGWTGQHGCVAGHRPAVEQPLKVRDDSQNDMISIMSIVRCRRMWAW